jgi:hypothetical protein
MKLALQRVKDFRACAQGFANVGAPTGMIMNS